MKSELLPSNPPDSKSGASTSLYVDVNDGDVYLVPPWGDVTIICSRIPERLGGQLPRDYVFLSRRLKRLEGPQTIRFTP